MVARRILRAGPGEPVVAVASPFGSEADLEDAIAARPEVLPSEELGVGTLVAVATQLDFGHGPLDLLAVDGTGHPVIVEFKKGSENPDSRRVIAQLLDYASGLWQCTPAELENAARLRFPGFDGSLAEHVAVSLERAGAVEEFNVEEFEDGLARSLREGDFVLAVVARDFDSRLRRVLQFAAGPAQQSIAGIEVEHYSDAHGAVLVPRVVVGPFRPSGAGSTTRHREVPPASEAMRVVVAAMDVLASDRGWVRVPASTGVTYRPAPEQLAIGVYSTGRGFELNLRDVRAAGLVTGAATILTGMSRLAGRPVNAKDWPHVPCEALVENWDQARQDVVLPFMSLIEDASVASASGSPPG